MLKCASFFAGVGGIDLGFEQAGFEVVYANEYCEKASLTYKENHVIPLDVRDIREVKSDQIPDFDIMLAGFPCQAFSVAGYRQGFDDEKGRGNLYFELERIIKDKMPQIVFLENVKNLLGHDKGRTFSVIRDSLETLGYNIHYKVLNAAEYGNIPQIRERIYVVGFLDKEASERFQFPPKINLETGIADIADFKTKVEDKYYYSDKCVFYDKLVESITKNDTMYQWRRKYVRENKSNACPTLTANMGTGGHNVPLILASHGIRKLTPKECFMFQGFGSSFKTPKKVANSHLYKQAGNSVVVPVIRRIADSIKDSIKPDNTPPDNPILPIELIPVEGCTDGTVVALVTINRPNKLNALNADVTSAIKTMVKWAETEKLVRCLIITGASPIKPEEGKRAKPNAFVAGADITEFLGADSKEIATKFTNNAIEALWNISKPTIAMVDGFALGGGLEVACSCDIRIASSRSKFGTPEINLGLIPGYGGTQRLVSLLGYGKALEMVYTGEMIGAEEAQRIGLVNHVVEVEELRQKALDMACLIATKSSNTLRVAKETLRSALDEGLTNGVATEAKAFANLFDTADKEIGVKAFLNREKPEWKHE
jgi:DNA (cytosine-5)-methyltransferase 1